MEVSIRFHRNFHLLPLNISFASTEALIYFHRRPSTFHKSITSIYFYGSSVYFNRGFHLLPWKRPSTSIFFRSMLASMEVAAASMDATDYFHLLSSICTQSSTSSFLDVPACYPDPQLDLIPFGTLLLLTNSSGAEMQSAFRRSRRRPRARSTNRNSVSMWKLVEVNISRWNQSS